MSDTPTPRTLAEWLRDVHGEPSGGCPPPEIWLAEEIAALPSQQRAALDRHAAGCAACSAERELARAFDVGEAAVRAEDVAWITGQLAPVPGGNRRPANVVAFPGRRLAPAFLRLAAAAALLLGVGLTYQAVRPSSPSLPSPPTGASTVRGGDVDTVAPLGEVATIPGELRWRPMAGAAVYRVRLLGVDDTMIWETRSTDTTLALPAHVATQLQPAVRYVWSVEALSPQGATLGRSEPSAFRVAPQPESAPFQSAPTLPSHQEPQP